MLLEAVQARGPGEAVWISARSWTAELITAEAQKLRANLPQAKDANIALCCREQTSLASAVCAFEGFAKTIVLLPANVSAELLRELLERCRVETVVSDFITADLAASIKTASWDDLLKEAAVDASSPRVSTRFVIPTSGTTAAPKLVQHSLSSLSRTVKRNARAGEFRWGLLYHISRFAGLQVFLQCVLGGSTLVIPAGASANLDETLDLFAARGVNAISATPTYWRNLLMSSKARNLSLRQITLGGEIADAPILTALEGAYPGARIVHVYASTEAGVGFSVTDGREGFPAQFLTRPPDGILLRVREDGMLLIKPKLPPEGYIDNNAQLLDEEGFVETGDLVRRSGERYLFLGRASGSINVGGNKVHPEEIERVLLAVPGVHLASVSAKRSAFTGAVVEARVVLDGAIVDKSAFRNLLLVHCRKHLEPIKVPAVLRVVDNLDTNASGKLLRN
jgi:acyl-CoA synthetase (AMP-forming)/AMP-acid ligase II